ncbi:hypothetical protein LDC_0411, partial [sediment metagenome]
KLADEGLFKYYGVAVWNAFILDASEAEHISLRKISQNRNKKLVEKTIDLGTFKHLLISLKHKLIV